MEELLKEIRDEVKAQTVVLLEMAVVLKAMSDHSAHASEEARRRLQDTASLVKGTPFEAIVQNLAAGRRQG